MKDLNISQVNSKDSNALLVGAKDLKTLSRLDLITAADSAVDIENDAIENTTRHFEEIFRRQDYLPDYPSMFEMLVRRWGYARSSAQMRLDTIRLIWDIPQAKEKLEAGEISMTVAAKMQSFLRAETKADRDFSAEEKSDLLSVCIGKTEFEAEKVFAKISPEIEKREVVKPISESKVRMNLNVTLETFEKLNELRDILSHVDGSMSLGDLLDRLAEDALDKYSPKRKAERAKIRREKKAESNEKAVAADEASARAKAAAAAKAETTTKTYDAKTIRPAVKAEGSAREEAGSARNQSVKKVAAKSEGGGSTSEKKSVRPANSVRPAKQTRYVPADERHRVEDDGLGCVFVNSKGRRCGSKKFLQLDHVHEFAKGGANTAENLRWMCGAHNRWRYDSPLRY